MSTYDIVGYQESRWLHPLVVVLWVAPRRSGPFPTGTTRSPATPSESRLARSRSRVDSTRDSRRSSQPESHSDRGRTVTVTTAPGRYHLARRAGHKGLQPEPRRARDRRPCIGPKSPMKSPGSAAACSRGGTTPRCRDRRRLDAVTDDASMP